MTSTSGSKPPSHALPTMGEGDYYCRDDKKLNFFGTRYIQHNVHHLVLAACLALAVWAYWPSLGHVARADHVSYLASMSLDDHPLHLIFNHYDFNRTRMFDPGDEVQFRPLFFIWLGCERALFGYHFWLWQLTGILLHLVVVMSLYRLLRAVRPGVLAAVCAGMFALLFSNLEAVIWHHINGYMIFTTIILFSMERIYRYVVTGYQHPRYLKHSLVAFSIAAFFHELGFIYAGFVFMFLLAISPDRLTRRRAWLFLLPVVLYVVLSVSHFILKQVHFTQGADTARTLDWARSIENTIKTFKWFFSAGFFVRPEDIQPIARLRVQESVFAWAWPGFSSARALGWAGLAAFVVGMFGAFLLRARRVPVARKFAVLLLAMVLFYPVIFSFGRVDTRGLYILQISLYYLYHFWILITIGAFAFIAGCGPVIKGWMARAGVVVLVILALVFCGRNVMDIRALNLTMAKDHTPCRVLINGLIGYVAEHKNEPGFTFFVNTNVPGNFPIDWITKRGDLPGKKYSLVELLYLPYFDRQHPKHYIQVR